ncbi:nitroreductase family deazaflavin-dependent oxidoreductase [Nocardia panacis]|uniref:Nitroreductase family deazaflavin-dependent oxidoreductase n=1 Tax=Nocardia panacis TaxID=2340916 RepID=A0A3A4K5J9_9NOCA|nr:nitroreductase family deazaflavin-dependent oxidoreductase [Nocardia panacis]
MSNPLPALARLLGRQPWVMGLGWAVRPLEQVVRWASRGRRGVLDLAGLPSLEITVVGRKTGLPRTTSLLCVPNGESLVVIGSNWGDARHPVWSANLRAADTATVRWRGERFTVRVEQVRGVDRKRLWDLAVEFWPGYEMEHALSGFREFRIFELTRM